MRWLWRLLFEEHGWGKIWTGLGIAVCLAGGGLVYQQVSTGGGGTTITCDQSSTSSGDFATDLSAISNGQTLCLTNAVSYGTFTGTNKTITIVAQSGSGARSPVNASMDMNFAAGDTGFTIDGGRLTLGAATGLTITGLYSSHANGYTIKNSSFTDSAYIEYSTAPAIILDNNIHDWAAVYSGGLNAKIFLDYTNSGTLAAPSVTIKNSQIMNGDLDGIHGAGSGYQILNNYIDYLCDVGTNHTDAIQWEGGSEIHIAGNYVKGRVCPEGTQGISSYDGNTNGLVIENNVVDFTGRSWGIEIYTDTDSIIRHNTLVWQPGAECSDGPCGRIDVGHKIDLGPSSGTQVYDNIATAVDAADCSGCSIHHNVSGETAVYVGPSTTHDGFLLDSSSPVGRNASSTGTDDGVCATTTAAGCS